MKLSGKIIVLTGASGGIGSAIARRLASQGATLILIGRSRGALSDLAQKINLSGAGGFVLAADIASPAGCETIRTALAAMSWPVDVLINCAGVSLFGLFEESDPRAVEKLLATNVTASIILTQLVLPYLNTSGARIVNLGSSFGALGYPGFAVYCASKFALRGFSEALRRELSNTQTQVAYLAPRATKTDMNTDAVCALNRDLGNAMDDPERVAERLEKMLLAKTMRDANIGWPERLFLRINALAPRVIDYAIRGQLPNIFRHARVGLNPASCCAPASHSTSVQSVEKVSL